MSVLPIYCLYIRRSIVKNEDVKDLDTLAFGRCVRSWYCNKYKRARIKEHKRRTNYGTRPGQDTKDNSAVLKCVDRKRNKKKGENAW